ncbi:hypothetical protein JCM8097_001426 [Rhodosporidiobolus ruineniae]
MNPFRQARAGSSWPPDVLKPVELIYESWCRSTFVDTTRALQTVNFFSNLRVLRLNGCVLDDDFLPSLLGPNQPVRQTLQHLDLVESIGSAHPEYLERRGYEITFAFLLEAMYLLDGAELRLRHDLALEDADGLVVLDEADRMLIEDFAGRERFIAAYPFQAKRVKAAERHLLGRCHFDWDLFREMYDPCAPTTSTPQPGLTPAPFSSLVSLMLDITDAEQLRLILFTRLFPALRTLTTAAASAAEINILEFQSLRYSITPLPPSTSSGTFLPPRTWATSPSPSHTKLLTALNLPLVVGAPVPPLSEAEREAYHARGGVEYVGPRLERLDLSSMQLEFDG